MAGTLSTDFSCAFLAVAFLAVVLFAVVLLAAFLTAASLLVGTAFLIGTLSCRARLVDAATARADLCSLEGGVTKSLSD